MKKLIFNIMLFSKPKQKEKQPRKIAPLRYQILTLQDVENEEISRADDTLFIIGNDGSNCACVEFTTRNCGNLEALNRFLDVYHQAEVAGIIPELILRQAGIKKEDTAFDYLGETNENFKYTVAPTHEFFGSVQNWKDGIIDCYFFHERQEDRTHYIYIRARETEEIMEASTLTEPTTTAAHDSDVASYGGIYFGDDYKKLEPTQDEIVNDDSTDAHADILHTRVTDAELAVIKSLSYDERKALNIKINQIDLRKVYPPDGQRRGFICPICGNGSGRKGDGIVATRIDDADNWFFLHNCFKGQDFQGKLFSIIARENSLHFSNDFFKILAIGKRLVDAAASSNVQDLPFLPTEKKYTPEQIAMRKADIVDAQKNIGNLPIVDRRNLSLQTLQDLGFGYIEKWQYSGNRINGIFYSSTPRIVAPYTDSTYNAIIPKSQREKFKHLDKSMNEGSKGIFNFDSIQSGINFIVEGEFDAASFYEVGYKNVAALGGTGYKNFIARLNEKFPNKEDRLQISFVVCLDNDVAGRVTAHNLVPALIAEGYPATSALLVPDTYKKYDANDILCNDGVDVLKSKIENFLPNAQTEIKKSLDEIISRDTQKENSPVENVSDDDANDELKRLKALPPSKERNKQLIAAINDKLYLIPQRKRAHMKWIADSLQENAKLIFENDPVVDGLVGYDEFYRQYSFLKPVFWRKGNCTGEQWKDADDKELARYLRDTYQNFKGAELIDINLTHYAGKNSFHPIKQYLESLQWDGTPRAETYFSKFLNVDDTPYTREVTLKWLLGAVSRIYHEGCDFQFAIVLHGKQGIGKGYCLRMLGKQWHVALMDSLDDSHAVDTIERGWIVEIAELAAGRKAELNAQKAFLSANEDTRRRAYARRADTVKRHCVFAISVNDEHFLKDLTGNRRYKILESHSAQNEIVEGLTVEYVNQVWAEVFHIYQELFKDKFDDQLLRLSRDVDLQADEIAEKHLQDDGLQGEIESFLDKPILPDFIWRWLNKDERRKFFVDEHIKFDEHELNYRIRANIKSKNKAQEMINQIDSYLRDANNNVYTDTVQVIIAGQKSMRKQYTLYGNTTRNETCAAEIFNECFGNDKRKNTNRINEILSSLADWKRVDKHIRNFSAVYGQQNISYWRGFLAINQ